MSCTVFYKGKLKKKHTLNELFEAIADNIKDTDWMCTTQENSLIIDLNDGESELLAFRFEGNNLDGFCKIFSTDTKVFHRVFDLFLAVQKMFSSFNISDDEGLWSDYIASKNPLKIKLRELTQSESELLNRFDKDASSSDILLSIIGNDIRKDKNDRITYSYLLDNLNPNVDMYIEQDPSLAFECALLETWVYETMTYKNLGLVCDLDKKTKGLSDAIGAFSFGITETIFKIYGGLFNSKQSEIRKLFTYEVINKRLDIDADHTLMFRFVLSVLDYLDFKRTKE